ncbi:STAS domain-containing protein [Pseudaquabacterium rugosum]|uniref:STAS domain-containing protein n=1 Tax=Pseudaquabacterium rugosum TaxID=2984194 RepID=A0ABU9B7Y6_9BURK
MSDTPARQLHALILRERPALLQAWQARLQTGEQGHGEALRQEMEELLAALAAWLETVGSGGDGVQGTALDRVLSEASQLRAVRGQSPESSIRFVQGLKDVLLGQLGLDSGAAVLLLQLMDRCVTTLVSQFVATREDVIRSQAQSLLDMSTPVITLWDSILLLPLVGVVDSVRAVQIAERLLETIGRTEAEVTLIDVTGVPVMDTSVARHLLRTVAAAGMLGTRVILTGISPSTAQTMVKLGIDMSGVPTRGTLKAGVALALQYTGRRLDHAVRGS